MTLPELFDMVGGDYQNVLDRLGDKETIQYFVLRFLNDDSYTQLLRYLRENNIKKAFYAAHTFKGVTQSLGFGRLGNCAVTLCEELRNGSTPSESLLQQIQKEYDCVIAAINDLKI